MKVKVQTIEAEEEEEEEEESIRYAVVVTFILFGASITLLLLLNLYSSSSLLILWGYRHTSGDRGTTVVKVLCYKSVGRWLDPSWCQWIFH